MIVAASTLAPADADDFKYTDEQFADIQMLRYKVEGFESLSLRQKRLEAVWASARQQLPATIKMSVRIFFISNQFNGNSKKEKCTLPYFLSLTKYGCPEKPNVPGCSSMKYPPGFTTPDKKTCEGIVSSPAMA